MLLRNIFYFWWIRFNVELKSKVSITELPINYEVFCFKNWNFVSFKMRLFEQKRPFRSHSKFLIRNWQTQVGEKRKKISHQRTCKIQGVRWTEYILLIIESSILLNSIIIITSTWQQPHYNVMTTKCIWKPSLEAMS